MGKATVPQIYHSNLVWVARFKSLQGLSPTLRDIHLRTLFEANLQSQPTSLLSSMAHGNAESITFGHLPAFVSDSRPTDR